MQRVAAGYPPALIVVGSVDEEVPLAMVDAFCAAVHSIGGLCDRAVYEGLGHGFFNNEPYLRQTSERAAAFLDMLMSGRHK